MLKSSPREPVRGAAAMETSSTQVLPQKNMRSPRGMHGAGLVGIPSHNTKSGVLPPLVNAPLQRQNNNQGFMGLTSPREERSRAEREKVIKQHERDLIADKAAAMVARAEREHQAVLEKAAQIRAKAEQDLKAKEEREATLKALQGKKAAENEWKRLQEGKGKTAEKKENEEDERPETPVGR